MGRRMGDLEAADQPMAAIGVDVILVAKAGNQQPFGELLAALQRRPGLLLHAAPLHRPSSVTRRMIRFPKGRPSADRRGHVSMSLCRALAAGPVQPLTSTDALLFLDRQPLPERLDEKCVDQLPAER